MNLKTYTKNSLVKKISSKLNMSTSESIILVDCVLDSFKEIFFEDGNQNRIEIRNFGIFKVVNTKKRENARNLITNEQVTIPSRKKIVFKAGKNILKQLNKKSK